MTEFVLPPFLAAIADRNRITETDVMDMRQNIYPEGLVSADDAVSLLAVDTTCRNKCDAWDMFFCEALSDFIVQKTEPAGHISEKNARWLISAVSRNGVVASGTEVEMLIEVIAKARTTPNFLSAYILKQVADAVIKGEGPLMKDRVASKMVVTVQDVAVIRRVLEASGGDQLKAISRDEAEILFILNDRSLEAQNDPSWNDLFVKAIANFMMGVSGYSVPLRARALQAGAVIESTETRSKRVSFERMVSDGMKTVLPNYLETRDVHAAYNRRSKERMDADEAVGIAQMSEAQWLVSRFGQGGFMRRNEKALLTAFKEQQANMHPELEALLDRVA